MHALDPTGRLLFVANRGTLPPGQGYPGIVHEGPGSISVFKVNVNSGALTEVTGSPFALSGGPAWVSVDPSGKYLYACSTATDLVYGFNIDQATGVLTALDRGSAVVTGDYPLIALTIPSVGKPGATVTFKSKFAYVPSSDNSLYGYAIDQTTGNLTAIPGSPIRSMGTGLAAAAVTPDGKRVYTAVAIDPTGRFLYTANGGSNDISGFSVDQSTGALTPLAGGAVATGHHPISATIDYSGRLLFVVSDADSSVSTYTIDPSSGALAPVTPATITGPMPKGLAISSTVETH